MKSSAERTSALERSAFSERLKKAIVNFDPALLSATVLAKEFSRRSRHSSVGLTAAHKWLAGEAIPQQEKLRVLANWLKVPVEWLRYGDTVAQPDLTDKERRRFDKLVSDFSALSSRDQRLIEKLIREMMKESP